MTTATPVKGCGAAHVTAAAADRHRRENHAMKYVIVTPSVAIGAPKTFPADTFMRDEKGYLKVLSGGELVAVFEPGWHAAEVADQDNTAGDTP